MLQYSRSTCSYVNNEAGWDLVYLKTRRQPVNKLRIIHDYKWTRRLGSLLNTSSKSICMCHITKKRKWGNKWTQSSERLLAIRISIWLGAHRSPASLREGGDILFMISGSFLSLLLCSCIWLLKWMNKMRLWEETLQSEHSNLTFFWGGLLLYYRCVCMRQRGVCSAIFKKEPLIFLTISVSLVPTFIFIFFLFLTFFPTACRSLSFGIGFFQSFQNN